MTETVTKLRGFAERIPISDPNDVPLNRQTILLYGEPKIGKTTEMSKMEDALFLDAEAGTMSLAVPTFEALLGRDRVNSPIREWKDIIKATDTLKNKIKDAKGVLVLDTIQEIYDICRSHVLDKHSIEHETDLGFGKGWRAVSDEFGGWIRELKSMPYGIVCIAHVDEIEVETRTMKFTKKIPRMDKGCRKAIEPFVNMILYAHTDMKAGKSIRMLRTKGTDTVTAGERGNPPRLPELIPFSYEALASAYDNHEGNTQS